MVVPHVWRPVVSPILFTAARSEPSDHAIAASEDTMSAQIKDKKAASRAGKYKRSSFSQFIGLLSIVVGRLGSACLTA
ncbi:hypothetical protein ABW45_13770 [Stenotrophomonas maltophilia]|nr:hypothetical protein ABW45_13770 [Stenotrophomonas maltophilia]